MFLLKGALANFMLLPVMDDTQADRPSIGWLHADASVRPAAHVRAFNG
jgi:hypothetical protein